jgi:hypothetical protein
MNRKWLHGSLALAVLGAVAAVVIPSGEVSNAHADRSPATSTSRAQPGAAGGSRPAQLAVVTTTVATTTPPASTSTTEPNSDDAAVAALRALLAEQDRSQFRLAWESLHPAQQALIAQDVYASCQAKFTAGLHSDITVIGTRHETVLIPGTQTTGPAVGITVKGTLSRGSATVAGTATLHEYYVDGRWRWTVSDPAKYTPTCN